MIGPGATGLFAGRDYQIAAFLAGGWTFLQPQAGWRLHVASESLLLFFDGANWKDLGAGVRELQNLTRLGVGTSADQTTPLAAKINAALFTAKSAAEGGGGDLRLTLNKETATRTVSQIYQSNYSGRAETGLTGDDNFRIKVSADGSQWRDSLVIDRNVGSVSFPSGGPTKILTFAASGVYTPSPGVRFVDVILFGGGGGGGGGAKAAAGVAAVGGGGGGGGGWARGMFPAPAIGASQSVTIGAGGAGGASQTTNSTAGANGATGGDTAFGALLRAFGGGGGSGGGLGVASAGGGGGNHAGAGTNASGATAGTGPGSSIGAGGSGATAATVTTPNWASGGGGSPATGAAGATGGVSYYGSSGGGSGGGVSATNAASSGGAGGRFYAPSFATVGAAGVRRRRGQWRRRARQFRESDGLPVATGRGRRRRRIRIDHRGRRRRWRFPQRRRRGRRGRSERRLRRRRRKRRRRIRRRHRILLKPRIPSPQTLSLTRKEQATCNGPANVARN